MFIAESIILRLQKACVRKGAGLFALFAGRYSQIDGFRKNNSVILMNCFT